MIGRRQVTNLAPACKACGVLVADVDVIWRDGDPFCSVECAPAEGRAESLEDAS